MPMSNDTTDAPPLAPTELAGAARTQARFGLDFLRKHGARLVLVFAGVLLPLWGFGELAEDVHESVSFPFDEPILQFAHQLARDGFDRTFLLVSKLGYGWGVVPADVVLVLVLVALRKFREGLFAAVALAGSALLNVGAKHLFGRARPTLWESIAPETTFSFPSGHAMGSMTFAAVLALLAWPTRWRWWVIVPLAVFVVMVGLSRVYLGVHYPSDILAGWTAALAWTVGCYMLVFRGRGPWARAVLG